MQRVAPTVTLRHLLTKAHTKTCVIQTHSCNRNLAALELVHTGCVLVGGTTKRGQKACVFKDTCILTVKDVPSLMHVYIEQQLKSSKEEQLFACENSSLHVKLYSNKGNRF